MREIPHFTADETDRGMENLNAGTNYRDSSLVPRPKTDGQLVIFYGGELSRNAPIDNETSLPYSQVETMIYQEPLDVTNSYYTDGQDLYSNC